MILIFKIKNYKKMLEVSGITKKYQEKIAVNNLNFSLKKGELIALLGPNGAGKSTTMKILTGFLTPDSGEVLWNGQEFKPENKNLKQKMGYLPENNPLYHDLTVKEYLTFASEIFQIKNQKKNILFWAEKLSLTDRLRQKIGTLSKGYKQRVGLAQALLHDPELLILDEPTTGLDPQQIIEIRNLIRDLAQEKTILLSTHLLQEVQLCDSVLLLHQGKKILQEKVENLQNGILEIETENSNFYSELKTWEEIENIEKKYNNKYEISGKNLSFLRQKIATWALEHQVLITQLQEKKPSLEEIFIRLTS